MVLRAARNDSPLFAGIKTSDGSQTLLRRTLRHAALHRSVDVCSWRTTVRDPECCCFSYWSKRKRGLATNRRAAKKEDPDSSRMGRTVGRHSR